VRDKKQKDDNLDFFDDDEPQIEGDEESYKDESEE